MSRRQCLRLARLTSRLQVVHEAPCSSAVCECQISAQTFVITSCCKLCRTSQRRDRWHLRALCCAHQVELAVSYDARLLLVSLAEVKDVVKADLMGEMCCTQGRPRGLWTMCGEY